MIYQQKWNKKDLYSLPNPFKVILCIYSVQFPRTIASHLFMCRSRLGRGEPKNALTVEVDHQIKKFMKMKMGHYLLAGREEFSVCKSRFVLPGQSRWTSTDIYNQDIILD